MPFIKTVLSPYVASYVYTYVMKVHECCNILTDFNACPPNLDFLMPCHIIIMYIHTHIHNLCSKSLFRIFINSIYVYCSVV